jgi:hypothetical protein
VSESYDGAGGAKSAVTVSRRRTDTLEGDVRTTEDVVIVLVPVADLDAEIAATLVETACALLAKPMEGLSS